MSRMLNIRLKAVLRAALAIKHTSAIEKGSYRHY